MNKKIILVGILLLALFLRVYKLGTFPPLNADEAAIGYNAYSLIETGADEHGNSWPIHFQSFNDYKPGLVFYLVIPVVKVFGLSVWSIRIIPALFGVMGVYLVYLFAQRLFPKKKWLAIFSSLFLAISPWHIHFSRGAWEVNVAASLILLGAYLFLLAKSSTRKILVYFLSILAFVAALYTYHAARVIVPFLGIFLFISSFRNVRKSFGKFALACFLAFLVAIPLVLDFFGTAGFSRAAGVGLFSDPGPLSRVNEQRGEHSDYIALVPKLFHNKLVNYGLAFLENWGEHYWGEFLFLSGDSIQRNRVPETGQFYIYEIVFVLVGLGAILSTKKKTKKWRLILFWLIVAPVAAALTFQSPHALRAHNMVIPMSMVSAYGFYLIYNWRRGRGETTWKAALLLLLVWGFARYQLMYWFHLPKEYPYSSQYGVRELVDYLAPIHSNYERVVVTDRYDQPYILFLFYMNYSPEEFQGEHSLTARDGFGFSTVRKFSNFEFVSIKYDEMRPNYPNSLLVGTDEEIPEEANIIKNIYFPNGEIVFQVVEN